MRLINLNAWGGKKLEELLALLNSDDFDFICLQEVFALQTNSKVSVIKNEKVLNLQELLEQNLHERHFFFSSTAGYIIDGSAIEYGNLIISKYPFQRERTVFYDVAYNAHFHAVPGDYSLDPRNLQITGIQLEHSSLQIMNTHGIWQPNGKKTDTERTLDMTKTIVEQLNGNKIPTILSGDLNLEPNTESIKQIDAVLLNLIVQNGVTTTRNKYKGVDEVVDYVFVSPGIRVKDFQVLDTPASDHNALILEFEVV